MVVESRWIAFEFPTPEISDFKLGTLADVASLSRIDSALLETAQLFVWVYLNIGVCL